MVWRHVMHTRIAHPPEAPSSAARERDAGDSRTALPAGLARRPTTELLRTVERAAERAGAAGRAFGTGHWYPTAPGGVSGFRDMRIGRRPRGAPPARARRVHAIGIADS